MITVVYLLPLLEPEDFTIVTAFLLLPLVRALRTHLHLLNGR